MVIKLRRGDAMADAQPAKTGTFAVKAGMAQMLKGGVIMDVVDAAQARIAEEAGPATPTEHTTTHSLTSRQSLITTPRNAGACAIMALERVPADIRKERRGRKYCRDKDCSEWARVLAGLVVEMSP